MPRTPSKPGSAWVRSGRAGSGSGSVAPCILTELPFSADWPSLIRPSAVLAGVAVVSLTSLTIRKSVPPRLVRADSALFWPNSRMQAF
jgi:hypothetical protein